MRKHQQWHCQLSLGSSSSPKCHPNSAVHLRKIMVCKNRLADISCRIVTAEITIHMQWLKILCFLFEKWLAWEQSGWEDEHVRHWVLEADGNEHGDREPNSNHLAGEVLIHQLDLAFQLLTDVTMALPLHGCNWTILNSSNSPTYDVCPSPWCTTTRPCKPANCTWYPSPHHGFPVTTNPSKLCEEQVQASAYLTYPDLTRKVPLN